MVSSSMQIVSLICAVVLRYPLQYNAGALNLVCVAKNIIECIKNSADERCKIVFLNNISMNALKFTEIVLTSILKISRLRC